MNSITGWLTPQKEFIECPSYKHMMMIMSDVRMQPDKVKLLLKKLDDIEKSCDKLAREQGSWNAEWHTYEMARDDALYKIWNILIDEGYMRICGKNDRIHFEGKSWVIKKNFEYCKDWALSFGCTAVFEPAGKKKV
jgi:hypothetical protein